MDKHENNGEKKNSNYILTITFIMLFLIYPLIQFMISTTYMVDQSTEYSMNWLFHLGLILTNGAGRGLGYSALILLIPFIILCSVLLGFLCGKFFEKLFAKQKHRNIVALIAVIVFVIYHSSLVLYLHQTSNLINKVIPINNDYRLIVEKVTKEYLDDTLWVNFRIVKGKNVVKTKFIDMKLIKEKSEYYPTYELTYSYEFDYVEPPFEINIGQVVLDGGDGSQPVTLSVYKNLEIRKVINR